MSFSQTLKINGVVFAVLFSIGAHGIAIGQISKGGTGCTQSQTQAMLSGSRLLVPLGLLHSKSAQSTLARSACSVGLPLQAKKGTRLVLKDLRVQGDVSLASQAKSTLNVEIFSAGDQGEVMKRIDVTGASKSTKRYYLYNDDVIASECGGGFTLRANSSVVVQSKIGSRSRISADWLRATVVEQSCI